MNEHTLRLLQFDRVLEEVQSYAMTEEGRDSLSEAGFLTGKEDVVERVRLASAYREALVRSADSTEQLPQSFPAVGYLLPRLRKEGAVLETSELRAIGTYVSSATGLKRILLPLSEHGGLVRRIEALPDIPDVPAAVNRVIDADGELKERDIPELRSIRGRIRSVQDEIRTLSSSYLSRNDFSGYWNSDVATLKDGRTVLPLKSQFKGRIRGIIHEVSTTGATIFIEPADIVEKNNDLVQTEARYHQEVIRILRDVTGTVARRVDELEILVEALTGLDGLHARARYAQLHDCFPALGDSGGWRSEPATIGPASAGDHAYVSRSGADSSGGDYRGGISLFAARHPLLGKSVVPVDIAMNEESRILIITGPNTGGKTVSLKTVGLLALMNQFGMEIPAGIGSLLPVFDDIFADIGDEQSIEQSLSTFSGHMRNIGTILRSATSDSLILLDELGSGTDPEEGSALAMAIIDRLLKMNVRAMVTTHHSILKNYGYTREGVSNASMDFDSRSLSPTYRIVLGVPGSSHAIDIAHRNGVPRALVDAARRYLHDEQTDAAGLIRRLTRKEQDFHRRSRELERTRDEVDAHRNELEHREEDLRRRELQVRKGAVTDLDSFVAETRRRLERLVRELREGELTREKTTEVKAFIEDLDERVREQRQDVNRRGRELSPVPEGTIEPGMEVTIGEAARRGTVVRKARGDMWVVSTGTMKVTLHGHELRPAAPAAEETRPKIDVAVAPREGNAVFELDVRGMRLEEAIGAVERQIDLASLQGLVHFGIIHGKGEGILQKGIHDYLRNTAAVESFAFARPEAGGFGKTNVQLRS